MVHALLKEFLSIHFTTYSTTRFHWIMKLNIFCSLPRLYISNDASMTHPYKPNRPRDGAAPTGLWDDSHSDPTMSLTGLTVMNQYAFLQEKTLMTDLPRLAVSCMACKRAGRMHLCNLHTSKKVHIEQIILSLLVILTLFPVSSAWTTEVQTSCPELDAKRRLHICVHSSVCMTKTTQHKLT